MLELHYPMIQFLIINYLSWIRLPLGSRHSYPVPINSLSEFLFPTLLEQLKRLRKFSFLFFKVLDTFYLELFIIKYRSNLAIKDNVNGWVHSHRLFSFIRTLIVN